MEVSALKAPTDKTNDTIQIIVTRACDLFNCSNCTQLLPFRKDPMHMSLECFRLACQSIADWPGIVGIFGGNPCVHPQFEALMEILVEEIPDQKHRGLWSNNLMKHGALVQQVFYPNGRFNLNAHAVPEAAAEIERWLPGRLIRNSGTQEAWHSAMLVDWADMGLTYEQWADKREHCDINTKWSAAIAERDGKPYAYFCEVAAAIDGVRDANHGLYAFPGWWRLKMAAFGKQVAGCCDKGCAVPLRIRGHLDREDVYDVSRSWLPATAAPRGKIKTELHEELPKDRCKETTDYMRQREFRKV